MERWGEGEGERGRSRDETGERKERKEKRTGERIEEK